MISLRVRKPKLSQGQTCVLGMTGDPLERQVAPTMFWSGQTVACGSEGTHLLQKLIAAVLPLMSPRIKPRSKGGACDSSCPQPLTSRFRRRGPNGPAGRGEAFPPVSLSKNKIIIIMVVIESPLWPKGENNIFSPYEASRHLPIENDEPHIGKCKVYLIKAFKKIKPNHKMLKKYIKADKKSFRLHDQNLKLRKASFRIFHSKRNVSFFFFLSDSMYSLQWIQDRI